MQIIRLCYGPYDTLPGLSLSL
ncbi:unnamed protein product, partial [Fusarium fujikuroi]